MGFQGYKTRNHSEYLTNRCFMDNNLVYNETWSLVIGLIHKLIVAQRAIERAMLRVSLLDKI